MQSYMLYYRLMNKLTQITGLHSLTAMALSAFIGSAQAQVLTAHVDGELIGPFPAHHLCVERQVRKILGAEAQFHDSNAHRVGADLQGDVYKSIIVSLANKHVTGLDVEISDQLGKDDGGYLAYQFTGRASVTYGNIGGLVEGSVFGESAKANANMFLHKVDQALRECNMSM